MQFVKAFNRQRIYYYLVQFSSMVHCWLQRYHARIRTLGSSLVRLEESIIDIQSFIMLCLGSLGMNCVIRKLCYKGTISLRLLNSFVKFHGKKIWGPQRDQGAQWLSSRVLTSRSRGCGFEHHRRHSTFSLPARHINPCLLLVQPRKTCPYMIDSYITESVHEN